MDRFKDKLKSGVVVLGGTSDSKVMLIAGVTPDLTPRFHAGNIIKEVAALVGGRGAVALTWPRPGARSRRTGCGAGEGLGDHPPRVKTSRQAAPGPVSPLHAAFSTSIMVNIRPRAPAAIFPSR